MISSYEQIKSLSDINKKYNFDIFINPSLKVEQNEIQDDNIAFQNKGIQYLHLIPRPFPNQHHKIIDKYENLNWKYIEVFINVLFEYLTYL